MRSEQYLFVAVPGCAITRRGIGFLEKPDDLTLNAKAKFDSLLVNREREVRSRFDHWISGGIHDKWFHGWPNDVQVKECFCFKWKDKRQNHRFYGFLYHPQPKSNPAFQICVLASHDVKNDESTNRTLLLKSMALRADSGVRIAINFVFPDEEVQGMRQPQ